MSMADYALCEQCGKKAFYDADTEIGETVVFHGECLPAHDRAVAARALRDAADVLDEEDPSMKYPVDPETVRIMRMLRERADRIERGEQ